MINNINEITLNHLKNYLRISESNNEDDKYLLTILNVAVEYIKSYTGIETEELNKYSDLIIVVYILVQDMYDNRSYYVDNSNVNKVVQSILDMHSRNFL